MLRLVLTALLLVNSVAQEVETSLLDPIVLTNSGLIQGIRLKSDLYKRDFNAFLSVPYAKPPLGALRFTAPRPVTPWLGVFPANRPDVQCVQFGPTRTVDTEDCLVLNVYAPAIYNPFKKLPVAVVIHGGGYVTGSGNYNSIKPEKFLDHDLIVVTINYRLGILGFLNTESEASPGNYGMLDQVLALKWVRDNIWKFGGDADQVTIIGNSAGGASVSYHILSPLSKGLFHAAIDESGSSLNPWAFIPHPINWARKAAGLTGCTQESTDDLVACLRSKTADEIFVGRQKEVIIGLLFNVGPSIDAKYGEGFLPDEPTTLLKKGKFNKVPVIAGFARNEGAPFVTLVNAIRQTSGRLFLNTEFCFFLTTVMGVTITPTVANECQLIVQEYFGNSDPNDPAVLQEGLVKIFGDALLITGISQHVELLAAAGVKLQAYDFDYLLEYAPGVKANYTGHGDELNLLFDQNYYGVVVPDTPNNVRMSEILVSIWTTFIIKGHHSEVITTPGEQPFNWPLYDTVTRKSVTLDFNPQQVTGVLLEKAAFWEAHLPIILGS